MARLYPSFRPGPSDKVSNAELDVLEALCALSEDWIVLHSLWLKTHSRKLHAEADFVLITDRGALILEIKGGDVWRDGNGWHFRTKSGSNENVKSEGPFDQARGAYYAIRKHLSEHGHLELFNEIVWGYGVICPDCVLHVPSDDPFIDPKMLLDQRGFPGGIETYLTGLVEYWASRHGDDEPSVRKPRSRSASVGLSRREELLRLLRPSFELVAGLGAESTQVERELIRLTDTQLMALDFMALEPRNMLLGAAGTGKTILVLEQARLLSAKGKRVLLLCFNKFLARKIASSLSDKGVEVGSYHQFAVRLCAKFGLDIPFSESWDEFCALLKERSADLISSLTARDMYDYVLIDEGQDLMNEEFMGLVDCVLDGGLHEGSWMISCDVRQAIFRDNFDESLLARICNISKKTSLDLNCRNTRQIAAYVAGFSGEGSTSTRGANGETPGFRYFDSRDEYLRILKKIVNELIQSFSEAGIPASEIVILFAERTSVPDDVTRPGFFLRAVTTFDPDSAPQDRIQLASIQAYKGLEAKAIVLLGIREFTSGASRGLFYVGASRAKTNLRVILNKDCDYAKTVIPFISEMLGSQAAS